MTSSRTTRRQATLIGLGLGAVGSFGCATTMLASSSRSTTQVIEGAVALTDDIVAFGQPDAAMAKSMGRSDVVAFLGTTNTYLLVEGGPALLAMTRLDPARLALKVDSKRLFIKDKTIWGQLEFEYASEEARETADERAAFKALGFERSSPQGVTRRVEIKGAVYPPLKVQGTGFKPMQTARKLAFRAPPTTETKPDVGKLVLLPVTILIDVVTAPLQLLGGAVMLLTLSR
jgi:hypothetical protein